MADAPSSILPSNEQLAAQLMECAILVKKGERGPLLRKTIHDLTDYLTALPAAAAATPVASNNTRAVPVEQRSTTAAVAKPTATSAFGVLGKMVGISDTSAEPKRSEASKAATSQKNAARVKADLGSELGSKQHEKKHHHWFGAGHHEDQEWCEQHFTMGCHCKQHKQQQQQQHKQQPSAAASSVASSTSGSHPINPAKPAFQRPVNTKSALIANGWIEQQRRSKMRFVWKDVLASLVEGRKPGEETTLWIQREVVNHSGIAKLEALHQIPVKWLQEIKYQEYSTEHTFSLKVYNLADEFVFRTPRDEEAAQNWVLTLRSAKEIAQQNSKKTSTGVDEWDTPNRKASSFEDEKKVPEQQREVQQSQQYPQLQQQQPPPYPQQREGVSPTPSAAEAPPNGTSHRMPIKELRAIAHGAGISTVGMERGELERVVAQIAQQGGDEEAKRRREHQAEMERRRQLEEVRMRQQQAAEQEAAARKREEEARKHEAAEEASKRKAAEEEAARRLQAQARQKQAEEEAARVRAAEEEKKRKEAEEETRRRVAESVKEKTVAERRMREEEERKKLEEERIRRDEEEVQRRIAEHRAAEERRRREEAYRQQQERYQHQQQAWQKQQAEEAKRRQETEQRAAEERRRQEEAFRRQQQWQQSRPSNQQAQPPNQQQWQQRFPQGPPPPQQQQQAGHRPPPNQQQWGSPPPNRGPQPQQQASPINQKYARMAAQTDDDSQLSIHHIKHGVLVQWALQPPNLQILRPIEVLISSVHTVFPPKFGVPGHEYFGKWTPVTPAEVNAGDEKIKKAVKKLRFFLHPDKLPRDLNTEQRFMCKMLWDITSDAYDEHKKKEEDLSWIKD